MKELRVTTATTPSLSEADAFALLEAFTVNVINDPSCRCPSSTVTPLLSATIVQYVKSAAGALRAVFGVSVSVLAPGTTQLLPVFHDLISHVRKWQQPRGKREPFTFEMFAALDSRVLSYCRRNAALFLSREAAVNDWVHLGCFTGSRGNEYCQTVKGRRDVSRVPMTEAAGKNAGMPIAFMDCDFTFFDESNLRLKRSHIIRTPQRVFSVHIRFRYDKSPINFSVRKFQRSGHAFLCPVRSAINIILRAATLQVAATDPLACYRDVDDTRARLPPAGYFFLESTDVIKVMRSSVEWAYPDPAHYMRINQLRVDCHSNRVTAAVALKHGGLTDEDIAFRLRWSVESVKHYMRDCNKNIGDLTQRVIAGSFML